MSKFAFLFLLVFVLGILAAFFYNSAFAFVIYQLIYFMNPEQRWWSADIPDLRYSFIAAVVMLGMLLFKYREYSASSPWKEQPTLKWMAALLIMYYIAYFFALSPLHHDKFTFDLTKRIVIIFVAYKLINTETMLNISMWSYLTGCTYIGYVATITGRNSGLRVEGIGMVDSPDANGTAASLVPAAVLLMYFAWQGSNKVRMIAVFMGAIIANGLVLINSRGAFLGVLASLGIFLIYMLFSRYQRSGQRAMSVALIIFGIGGALYVTDESFWERMSTISKGQDGAETSRTVYWFKTFDMLKDHPQGLGVYGYNTLAPLYMDEETRGGVEQRSVHSSWFQGLSEVGWVGFGIFIGMLYSLFTLSRKVKKSLLGTKEYDKYFKVIALECALIGFLVAGTFINRFRAEILYWMILFLMVAIKLYYLQQKPAEKTVLKTHEYHQ